MSMSMTYIQLNELIQQTYISNLGWRSYS